MHMNNITIFESYNSTKYVKATCISTLPTLWFSCNSTAGENMDDNSLVQKTALNTRYPVRHVMVTAFFSYLRIFKLH